MRWQRRLPLSLTIACLWPAFALAQTTVGSLQLNQYQPTPFSDRVLRLDGPRVLPLGQFRVGMDADYAFRPLVLVDPSPLAGTDPNHNVVEHAVGGSLLVSFGLGHRLEAGLAIPLTLFQSGQNVAGAVDPSVAGVGNLRLGLKATLLDRPRWGVGVSLSAAVPGGVGTLTHETGVGGEGRLFLAYRKGPIVLGARGGLALRAHHDFYDVSLGNEVTAAAGVTWQLLQRTSAIAELAGVTAAGSPFADGKRSPFEVLMGVRQRVGKTWLTLAGGPGLVNGYGSPLFRLVAGLTWANRPPDADGDGIPDDDDRCPLDAEDRDGFEDSDGCPDPDNDKDGVPDAIDKCPLDAEDRDGFEDSDGCPDLDNDKDGVPDATDKCPDKPETLNEFEDEDGCPDEAPPTADKDKDGIPDDSDECPEEAEDKDGFEDDDGCPDLDNDKDGIPDATDKCPLEPETINGIDDDDGCPDKGQTQVRLGQNEIETLKPIYFDTDRSRVRHAFYNILGQIASLLKAHPEIGRCAVEGHTDDTGPTEWNEKLSQLRAVSVIEFLSNKGVDPKRLVPIGHGEKLPWASNETPEGRAKNRRVVFHIEGVNPEEEKKREQRQERRQRIRHRREADQSQPATPSAVDSTSEPAGKDAPKVGPKIDSKIGPKIDSKIQKIDPKVGPKIDPKNGSTTAPTPGPKGTATAPKGTRAAPSSESPAPASESTAASPKAAPNDKTSAPKPSARGERPTRKTTPDAGSGEPPTLKDLLKLPPR